MTLNEWIKKWSPFNEILTQSGVAASLGLSANTLKYRMASGNYLMKDQKKPKLVKVGE